MSSRTFLSRLASVCLALSTPFAATVAFTSATSFAQTGGEGAISGTVTDATGALVPNATVVAKNVNTGVETKRTASGDGLYNLSPIIPGMYTVTVTAPGFTTFKQENIQVNAVSNFGLNVSLKTGSESETVTVTDAPPSLETTNSTLGGTIDNATYTALPVMITGSQQRDITQFSNLLPGAQVNPGGRSSIIGGTGQRLGELYLDGLPLTTLSQQGDNRPILNIVPLEAIDQVKVVTSGFNAEYQGAGLENYNTKSGGNKYHGAIFGYFRNTAFDAWSFASKPGGGNTTTIVQNGVATKVPGPKPAEHQTELGFTIGGPIKIPGIVNGHDKLFFFATYDKFRSRIGVNPTASTIATTLMRQGDFRELIPVSQGGLGGEAGSANPAPGYKVYDPTSQTACTAFYGTPCRYQYGFTHGATPASKQVATGAPINVIPASQLSPITQYMQKYLPTPTIDTVGTITNNYLGGNPTGYDNWLYSGRIDYTISPRQTLSAVLTGGNRHAVPYTSVTATGTNGANLPVPYLATTASTVAGHWASVEHTFILTPNLVNQFKYGFMNFGGPPVQNLTQGNPLYSATSSGITGLPAGQASENFPNTSFAGSNAQNGWVGNTPTSTSVSETYTLKDNLSYLKGKHSMNFGFQYQWLETNASTADGASQPMTLNWTTNSTANVTGSGSSPSAYAANTGYSYASFLLGAVGSSAITQQAFGVLGGRFHPFAPYFQDDFKVTPKLTLNLGLRWDYIPTYREAQDRWSFLNPNITNPVTGNLGALQFAGNRGVGISCNCRTPINDYKKNWGPRLGIAYSIDDKTVIRGGFAILYSHAGGTGGAGGAATGTSQMGFTSAVNLTDSFSGPAFYLNGGNSNWGGPGYSLPGVAPINAVSQTLGTGYYVCSGQSFTPCNGTSGGFAGTGTSVPYADPYIGGRAPTFNFWNFGMQREVTNDITVSANYVGSQSHFLAGANNIRGLYTGQLDPKYLALGPNLTKPATAANLAAATAATGIALPVPYAGYTAAANLGGSAASNATIAHMLTWMPQYNMGTSSDPWGNVANANYNAFQLSVVKRAAKGLTLTVNYTYSHNIDDTGTQRSGYAIPASATANGQAYAANRMDRSLSINSVPQNLSIYGVYQSPFGKDKIGGSHFVVRALLGGWQTGNIFQYSSGVPMAITATCNASNQNVGQGQCMPDYNPAFSGSVRTGGGWGEGLTAATLGSKSYLNGYVASAQPGAGTGTGDPVCSATTGPFCNSGSYKIGNLARIAPYGLRGPGSYRLTSNLHRTFDLTDRAKFIFGVDCQNVTNSVTFGNLSSNNQISSNVNSASFGTVTTASADPRAFQFSGRFTF